MPRSSSNGTGVTLGLESSCKGSVNQNVEPSPDRLVTPMVPPIRLTNRLEIARPNPVPP